MAKRITINELDKSTLSSSTFENGKIATTDTIKQNISSSFNESSVEKIASTKLTNMLDGRVNDVENLIGNSDKYLFVNSSTDYDESGVEIVEENGIATVTTSTSFTLPRYSFNFTLNIMESTATKVTITKGDDILYTLELGCPIKRVIDNTGRVTFVDETGVEIGKELLEILFNMIVSGDVTVTPEGGYVTLLYPVNQISAENICCMNKLWYSYIATN
jgi:hypothetical protein